MMTLFFSLHVRDYWWYYWRHSIDSWYHNISSLQVNMTCCYALCSVILYFRWRYNTMTGIFQSYLLTVVKWLTLFKRKSDDDNPTVISHMTNCFRCLATVRNLCLHFQVNYLCSQYIFFIYAQLLQYIKRSSLPLTPS